MSTVVLSYLQINILRGKSTPAATPSVTPTTLLTGLLTDLSIQSDITLYNYRDWLSDDTPLPLTGEQILFMTNNLPNNSSNGGFIKNDLDTITTANLQPLITRVRDYFLSQDFIENKENTRVIKSDAMVISYYGFEKNELKCILEIDEKTDPFGNVVCGVIDTKQAEEQKAFIPVLIGSDYYGDTITSFRIEKAEASFARGTANGTFSGYTWMAKNINGTWKIVWRGQEIPLCSEMERLGIPQAIYESCYYEPA